MSKHNSFEAEVVKLQNEIARLREELHAVAHIRRDEEGKIFETSLHATFVTAQHLMLLTSSGTSCGMISSDEHGPYLSFWGKDNRARLILRVNDEAGELEIYDGELKPLVQIYAGDECQHGHVAVLSRGGVPRAVMKGMDSGGAITAVDPQGKPRATLHSLGDKGEVALLRDGKIAAKIGSTNDGGMMGIHDSAGKSVCSLIAAQNGNGLFVHQPDGTHGASLASTVAGTALHIGQNNLNGKTNSAVEISELPGIGGHICFHNAKADVTLELFSDPASGGALLLTDPVHGGHVDLRVDDGGGRIETARAESKSKVVLGSSSAGAAVMVNGEEQMGAALSMSEKGGVFSLRKGEHVQGAFTVTDDGETAAFFLTNRDHTQALGLGVGNDGGQVLVAGNDGVTRASLYSNEAGAQLTLFNELGIERATVIGKQDNGGMHLRFGGVSGLVAAATDQGGMVSVFDSSGQVAETFPAGWNKSDDE